MWAPIIWAWYVCPASLCPFPPSSVGCLALASLRYTRTVTAGRQAGWAVPPRNCLLGLGSSMAFRLGTVATLLQAGP